MKGGIIMKFFEDIENSTTVGVCCEIDCDCTVVSVYQ